MQRNSVAAGYNRVINILPRLPSETDPDKIIINVSKEVGMKKYKTMAVYGVKSVLSMVH